MSDDILKVGNKIEIDKVSKADEGYAGSEVYVSQILELDENGEEITVAMPMFNGHVVPLAVDQELNVYFYSEKGIFRAKCRVVSRGNQDNIYIMKLKLISEMKKFQRRQFYRLLCNIEAIIRILNDEQVNTYLRTYLPPVVDSEQADIGMIVDISGGGVRIMTDVKLDVDSCLFITFPIKMNIGDVNIEVLGKVVASIESPNRENYYDNRIQFKDIDIELRDTIVKYIYEQQRKIQRRERR